MPLAGRGRSGCFVARPSSRGKTGAKGKSQALAADVSGVRCVLPCVRSGGESRGRCPDRASRPLRQPLALAGGRRTPGSGLSNETGRGTFWWPRPILVTTLWPTRWQCNVRLFQCPPEDLQNRESVGFQRLHCPQDTNSPDCGFVPAVCRWPSRGPTTVSFRAQRSGEIPGSGPLAAGVLS